MLFWQRGLPSRCSERAEVLRCLPQGFHEWRLMVNDEGIHAKGCARCDVYRDSTDGRLVDTSNPDEAYRVKYGRYGSSYVKPMTSDSTAETALQLKPAG